MDSAIYLTTEQLPANATGHTIMPDKPYCKAVGALNWATLATCPNIAFAISTVARFTANPKIAHWDTVKQIYRYLAGTCDL
jgi:hypothetical protein